MMDFLNSFPISVQGGELEPPIRKSDLWLVIVCTSASFQTVQVSYTEKAV